MPLYTNTTYPGWPAKPAIDDTEGDPTQALQDLLSGSSPTYDINNPGGNGGNRNSAIAGAIRTKYGLGPDRGDISQSDLEALDSFVRGNDTADKLAPIKEQAKNAAAAEAQKAKDALDLENVKGQYGLQGDAMKAQALRDVAAMKEGPFGGGGGSSVGGTNPTVDYWANQVMNSPKGYTVLSSIKDKNMLQAVQERIAQMGGNVKNLTNQTMQMGESASAILDQMPNVLNLGEKLNQAGLFHPVVGSVRTWLANNGAASLAGVDPQTASDIGDFNTQMGLLQSGMARAHAGARGAGNSAIAARFEQLLNAKGDYPTFLGAMRGAASFLGRYQAALHNGANPDDPNDPLLKQLDQQLQQEGGGSQGADLGANWGQ